MIFLMYFLYVSSFYFSIEYIDKTTQTSKLLQVQCFSWKRKPHKQVNYYKFNVFHEKVKSKDSKNF